MAASAQNLKAGGRSNGMPLGTGGDRGMTASRGDNVDQPPRMPNTAASPPDFRARLYQNYASLMERTGPDDGEVVRRDVRGFAAIGVKALLPENIDPVPDFVDC